MFSCGQPKQPIHLSMTFIPSYSHLLDCITLHLKACSGAPFPLIQSLNPSIGPARTFKSWSLFFSVVLSVPCHLCITSCFIFQYYRNIPSPPDVSMLCYFSLEISPFPPYLANSYLFFKYSLEITSSGRRFCPKLPL